MAGWFAVVAAVAIALGVPPQLRVLGRLRFGGADPGVAFIVGATGLAAIIAVLAVLLGVALAPQVGLTAPVFDPSIAVTPGVILVRHVAAGLAGGLLASLILPVYYLLAPRWLGNELFHTAEQLRIDMGLVACVALGGVVEELVFRWGVMAFIAWMLSGGGDASLTVQWVSIAGAAVVFGAAHLPGAIGLAGGLTPGMLGIGLLLNGWLGVVAGWLAWNRGLLAAMVVHGTVHVVWWLVERARDSGGA